MRSGTLSYRSAAGFATASPASTVVFAPEALPASVPDHQGVRVALVRDAQAGAGTIQVNDVTQVDPQMALLIKSPDGQRQEIHNVAALFSDTDANVKLTAPLQSSFPTNSAVTQQPGAAQEARGSGVSGAIVAVVAVVALTKDDDDTPTIAVVSP